MKWIAMMLASVLAMPLWAQDIQAELVHIQQRWAEIQYQLPEDDREKAFEALARDAETFVADYPGRAEPLIWQGIVLSTYAGAKGGLGALGLVKEARASLEAALDIDPEALDGSAYRSLGSLYYQVPGCDPVPGVMHRTYRLYKKTEFHLIYRFSISLDQIIYIGDIKGEYHDPAYRSAFLRRTYEYVQLRGA